MRTPDDVAMWRHDALTHRAALRGIGTIAPIAVVFAPVSGADADRSDLNAHAVRLGAEINLCAGRGERGEQRCRCNVQ